MEFTFMDLFSGIGGFHQALSDLGGKCVFASEINDFAARVYENNYKIKVDRDITKINIDDVPYAEVLAAGFPCQSFSKAGFQNGFKDNTKGTLFFNIKEILKHFVDKNKPIKYILLENVRNLASHDGGKTWDIIRETLRGLGYNIHDYPLVMGPTDLEEPIPQSRDRVFILGVHKTFNIKTPTIEFTKKNKNRMSLVNSDILEINVDSKYDLDVNKVKIINMWQDLLDQLDFKPSFPVWGNYFKYPDNNPEECPEWKLRIISRNKYFYNEYKNIIDPWAKKHNFWNLKNSFKKLEWQCQDEYSNLNQTILQFRPSGLRAKKPTYIPALVAINHVPIIYRDNKYRKLTPKECARLQSFPENFKICSIDSQAYKQFGNSVNVDVVKYISDKLLEGHK